MLEYLFASDEHREDIIDFINYIFSQAHCPHDFKTLIPKVYADGRGYAGIHSIALENDRVRGVVAQYPVAQKYAGAALSIGYIGSVSTYKYTRGSGHMIKLMDMQIKRAEANGVDIMMLGGQRQRYEYYGFSPCGGVIEYRIVEANVRHGLKGVDASGVNWKKFGNATQAEIDEAYKIYQAQTITGARPREDFDIVMRSWNAEPYVILDGARVVGYLDARDSTFTELVLLSADFAPKLIKAWFAVYAPEKLYIYLPPFEAALNRSIARFAEGDELSDSEQARIINLKNTLNACMHLKKATSGLSDGKVILQMDDDKPVCARVKNGEIDVFETDDAPDVRLSRLDMQTFLLSTNRYMAPDVACPVDWFPLPLFLYTADHF